ncbi:MAG: hypothetical protein WDW36_004595 [Sanguina aurantia]
MDEMDEDESQMNDEGEDGLDEDAFDDDSDSEDDQPAPQASTSGRSAPATAASIPSGPVYFEKGKFVELGFIVSAHGIRGEVKINVSTDNPKKRLGVLGNRILLRAPIPKGLLVKGSKEPELLKQVTTAGSKVRVLGKGVDAWLVKFKEVGDKSQADALRGYTLLYPLEAREALRNPDEFYAQDLVGCSAFDQATGNRLGVVVDIFSGTGTYDTLAIQLRSSKEDIKLSRHRTTLVPFERTICPKVDLALKRLEVAAPEGLLDLFTAKKMKRPLTPEQQLVKLAELDEELKKEAGTKASRTKQ